MTQKIKSNLTVKGVFFAGLLAASLSSAAQRPSVTADPELGKIVLVDQTGFAVDANAIVPEQVINLRIPVMNDGHGNALPAGSCKIKIGLGSKLVLDPLYNINNTALSSYFKWTSANSDGQVQITGDLVAPLPANVTEVNVAFKVKAGLEGKSTITANFLITNHNTAAVLSDEDGSNNGTALAYRVTGKVAPVSANGKLQLSLYPNPVVTDTKAVVVKVEQGQLKGRYSVTLMEMGGKLVQANQFELNGVPNFRYNFGNIAAGKYMLKIVNADASESFVLKFEKL